MTDLPEPDGGLDAMLGAQAALNGHRAPDADMLEAIEAGLHSVSAHGGALAAWPDIPHQRPQSPFDRLH